MKTLAFRLTFRSLGTEVKCFRLYNQPAVLTRNIRIYYKR